MQIGRTSRQILDQDALSFVLRYSAASSSSSMQGVNGKSKRCESPPKTKTRENKNTDADQYMTGFFWLESASLHSLLNGSWRMHPVDSGQVDSGARIRRVALMDQDLPGSKGCCVQEIVEVANKSWTRVQDGQLREGRDTRRVAEVVNQSRLRRWQRAVERLSTRAHLLASSSLGARNGFEGTEVGGSMWEYGES